MTLPSDLGASVWVRRVAIEDPVGPILFHDGDVRLLGSVVLQQRDGGFADLNSGLRFGTAIAPSWVDEVGRDFEPTR